MSKWRYQALLRVLTYLLTNHLRQSIEERRLAWGSTGARAVALMHRGLQPPKGMLHALS